MARDLTKTIDVLRGTAVGRCRERLELAAQKAARALLNNEHPEEHGESPPCREEKYGVTSF